MTVNSHRGASSPDSSGRSSRKSSTAHPASTPSSKGRSPTSNSEMLSPKVKAIVREAEMIEHLLGKLYSVERQSNPDAQHALIEDHPKLKHLNSFGKQVMIRMFRSSERFWGYKVDFDRLILKPDVLFLVGTLCEHFDYMNTSPMGGLSVLDVGCGALSIYGQADDGHDLLTQFYRDRPPIAAELLQMLGAKTVGVDPRSHDKADYNYDAAYRHVCMDFVNIPDWLRNSQQTFDILSCLSLFNRQGFLFDHHTSNAIASFLQGLKHGLTASGLLYTSPPLLPSTPEYQCENRRIFTRAGFHIVYEGYFFILQPR